MQSSQALTKHTGDTASVWLGVSDVAVLGVSSRTVQWWCKSGRVRIRKVRSNGGRQYQILLSSLPEELQNKYHLSFCPKPTHQAGTGFDPSTALVWSNALPKAREIATRRLELINQTQGLQGAALKTWIGGWNAQHQGKTVSYSRLCDFRKEYRESGVEALLPKSPLPRNSIVPDDLFEAFKGLYMKEGSPGSASCWRMVMGKAREQKPDLDLKTFPSRKSFIRRLRQEIPTEAQYLARSGHKKWYRKYASYIRRDYSALLAGQVFVADHAQLDLAVSLPDGKYCFPWITSWRCMKSGKWVGWELRPQSPSSDPIFTAFYRAGTRYGIPSGILVDQGKDFRSRDLTGGRRRVHVEVDVELVRSLTAGLGIEVNFAQVYNAQTKPIERDFLNLKQWLSVHAIGYRGGNVVERPESLNERISEGAIETFEELRELLDTFVTEVLNRSVVNSGHRAGKCPDEIWDAEAPVAAERGLLRTVTPDALKLFCSRTSGDMVIGRNGVRDSQFGCDYWDDWMVAQKGRKCYLRRDPQHHESAWIFNAASNEYLGQGHLIQSIPALAQGPVEREQLGEAIRLKRRSQKAIRALARADSSMSLREKTSHITAATRAINDARGYVPADYKPGEHSTAIITDMDRVVATEKRKLKRGKGAAVDRFAQMPLSGERQALDPLAAYYLPQDPDVERAVS